MSFYPYGSTTRRTTSREATRDRIIIRYHVNYIWNRPMCPSLDVAFFVEPTTSRQKQLIAFVLSMSLSALERLNTCKRLLLPRLPVVPDSKPLSKPHAIQASFCQLFRCRVLGMKPTRCETAPKPLICMRLPDRDKIQRRRRSIVIILMNLTN